ncbi:hypothetical protein AMR72_06120 [Flavobacterium psychrophilum]|nr:hypothetical protein AMR72_06120 [Flavobacterium psychrophilum]AOE52131.1 hypothetical protein ALW18_06110 [Flavobacterium psychrophilum]
MKKTITILPELFFMGGGLFFVAENYFTLGSVNYFALLVTWLLFLQFFYKNRIAGLVYGIALGTFSVFNLVEMLSGVQELQTKSAALSSVAIIMAAAMVYKYVRAKNRYDESVLTATY